MRKNGFEKTSRNQEYKKSYGYDLRRTCKVKACKGVWCLKINIEKQDSHVYFNEKCKHCLFNS